jgi:hypothetical protein
MYLLFGSLTKKLGVVSLSRMSHGRTSINEPGKIGILQSSLRKNRMICREMIVLGIWIIYISNYMQSL